MILVLPAFVFGETNSSSDWISLFDGQSLTGWKAAENPETWSVQDGQLIAHGKRSHLFYAGPVGQHDFENFELLVEAQNKPRSKFRRLFSHRVSTCRLAGPGL